MNAKMQEEVRETVSSSWKNGGFNEAIANLRSPTESSKAKKKKYVKHLFRLNAWWVSFVC